MNLDDKMRTLTEKNTFFIPKSGEVEERYADLITKIKESLRRLCEGIKKKEEKIKGEDKEELIKSIADFLQKDEHGLNALLALSGTSYEKLYRIISYLRITYKRGIYKSDSEWLKKDRWPVRKGKEVFSEWKEEEIKSKLKEDESFAKDLAKILLGCNDFVNAKLSEFERGFVVTLDKLRLTEDSLLDTLIRRSLSGSYAASKGKVPEEIVKEILDELGVSYESGKIKGISRRIDLVIPSKCNPKIFIQISYEETTSSGMGDKAKTERDTVRREIKEKYQGATFILFVDGAGWLTRDEAARVICEAGDYIFTFHEESLEKFKELIKELKGKYGLSSQKKIS
ncbi:MAG: hypothetical protein DRN00_04055 [Thermoplasmata archaeon]|nr:MAG: hypothetical protein DRN00_04055 [Thermoplasmata archaeon]